MESVARHERGVYSLGYKDTYGGNAYRDTSWRPEIFPVQLSFSQYGVYFY